MSIPIAQGRNGYMTHSDGTNTLNIPVKSWALNEPRNLVVPVPVSNSWATNFAEGLRSARVVVNYDFRDSTTELLSSIFWNWWFTRSFVAGFDDTPALTLVCNNSQDSYTMALAKPESFTFAIKPGMQIGVQAVYAVPAPAVKTLAAQTGYTPFDSTRPVMFSDATFTGITGDIYGVEIGYSNNHLPRAPINGTNTLTAWDGGPRTCNARFDFAARALTNTPFADAATLTVGLVSSTRVWTLSSVVPNITDDQNVDLGQVFTPWPCTVLGSTISSTVEPPLFLST